MNSNNLSLTAIVDQFRDAMAAAGLPYHGQINTDAGKITRFTVDGDRPKSMTGWYVLYTDGIPAGEFGCWKRGLQLTWCAKAPNEITPAEREAIERRRRESEAARKKAEAELHAETAKTADVMWEACKPCTEHPYLTRKGVQSHGLRAGTWRRDVGEREVVVENALLVPVRDGKKLVSLQAIFPSRDNALGRDKDFLPGGKKRGCFYAIGKPAENDNTPTVYICEGYATGASIHEATGEPVIVAFDAGNLKPVAERIRARYPQGRLVVAADNDRWTTQPFENPGVHYGQLAAKEVGAALVVPDFQDLTNRPTDFNDLHAAQGIAAVLEQVTACQRPAVAPTPAPAPANDNAPDEHLPATQGNDIAAVDWYSPFPDFNGKGKPLATIENVVEACRRLGVTVRYNVIRKDIEILIPGQAFSVDNRANASLAWLASACNRFSIPTGSLGDFLCYMADQNLYNPVANWITSRPWDGQSRLQDLFDTIQAEDEALKEILIKRWMVSAVAGAFKPDGVSAHGVLVLQGDQYLGKTKWFKSLVPADLGVIQDGLMLRPDDRDSIKQVVSYWLVELGELDATFRKSDIAQLKSFLTRDRDVIRRAYAKMESEYARRTVFFASVNPREFLHDQTGNRRYWTIEAKWIDHSHSIDMQQLWAEVFELWKAGETYYLGETEMAMLNKSNEEFVVIDPIQDRINSRLDWKADTHFWHWRSATDILLDVGIDKPNQSDATRAAAYIRTKNGNKGKRTANGRMLWCPPKHTTY